MRISITDFLVTPLPWASQETGDWRVRLYLRSFPRVLVEYYLTRPLETTAQVEEPAVAGEVPQVAGAEGPGDGSRGVDFPVG